MVFAGRTALGLGLGSGFSIAGIGIAWGFFVFSSSRSQINYMISCFYCFSIVLDN